MPQSKKPFAYFALNQGDGINRAYASGSEEYVDGVLEKWKNAPIEGQQDPVEKDVPQPDFTHESALTDALSRAVDFGLAQAQLIEVTSVAPTLFSGIVARETVVRHVRECGTKLQENGIFSKWALNEDDFFEFEKRNEQVNQIDQGMAALPGATLMSLVATFDSLVVDIVSSMLQLDRDWLSKSDKTFPFSRLATASDIDELIKESVSDELYLFSRGSHDEQAAFIRRTFGVDVKTNWKRWGEYIEVFERRNLVAHGEKKFNRRYADICEAASHKGTDKLIGKNVELTPAYLRRALDILLEFAVLLPFSLWRKMAKDKESEAFENLNEASFKLIKNRRYVASERILEYALGLQKVKVAADVRLRLIVNRASALRHAGNETRSRAILDEVDWSGSQNIYRLCVASVAGNIDDVCRYLPLTAVASEGLSARDFQDWPCFSFVRDDEKVKQAFETTFGFPMPFTPAKGPKPTKLLISQAPTDAEAEIAEASADPKGSKPHSDSLQ